MLPFEFIVVGIPISHQTKNRARLRAWQAQVRTAAQARWPSGTPPVVVNVRMRIVYYYDGASLDTDNMIKPIQDALNGLVFEDDQQVTDLVAGKRSLNGSYRVRGMSQVLATGFVNGTDFIYVLVEEAPDQQELL